MVFERENSESVPSAEELLDVASRSRLDMQTVLLTLLSRLDANQAGAFRRKMAELDAERRAHH